MRRRLQLTWAALAVAGASLTLPAVASAKEDLECHDCAPEAYEPDHGEPPDEPAADEKGGDAKADEERGAAKKPSAEKSADEKSADEKSAPTKGHAHDHEHTEPDDADAPASDRDRSVDIEMSSADIRRLVRKNLKKLGSMSVGRPQQGTLVNPVRFPDGKHWRLMAPGNAYATQETVDYLERAILKVQQTHPGGHDLWIGDISSYRGGRLKGHRSHQAGRDVDISFYYRRVKGKPPGWYRVANAETLDVDRTWAFVRALLTETDVKFIFINTSVQKLLKEHALKIGEDPKWLDRVFQYKSKDPWPIIRHSPGHDTHIHIRFYNPKAQEMGRRAYPHLVSAGVIKPPVYYKHYVAKKGDILGRIAKKFDVSVDDIVKANKIHGTKILAGRTYRIPKEGHVHPIGRVNIPPRRLPEPKGGSGKRARAAGK